jgi:hypothetical protein
MKVFALMVLFMMFATLSTGCLIRTRNHNRNRAYRSCPPAHHWDGYSCVHNGRGRGPKVRDHRR